MEPNEGVLKKKQDGGDHFEKVLLHLQAKEKALEKREKQIQLREARNEAKRRKIHRKRRMTDIVYRNIIGLEKKLDRGASQVMKEMKEGEEDMERMKRMDAIKQDLKEMKEALNEMEQLHKSKVELQEARKLLIQSMREGTSGASIGVRRIGEFDIRPFRIAMKRKFPDEAEEKAVELCSMLRYNFNDPSCQPFKIIADEQGNCKKILDVDNGTLKFLKIEYGEEVYNATKKALTELNKYNPTGRYTKLELWNFKDNRKATLKEGISHILRMWKGQKQKTK